jgi:hypothetical protein
MTRKDYQIIAATLWHRQPSEVVNPERFYTWRDIVTDFKHALESENPRFDPQKFYDACYLGKGLR